MVVGGGGSATARNVEGLVFGGDAEGDRQTYLDDLWSYDLAAGEWTGGGEDAQFRASL